MNVELTEKSYIYQQTVRLANKEIKFVVDRLKETEHMWNEFMDLKMHDASSLCYDGYTFEYNGASVTIPQEKCIEYFDDFCRFSYEDMIEYFKENGIDFDKFIDRVGRTSSFYLTTAHNAYAEKWLIAIDELWDESSVSYVDMKQLENEVVIDEVVEDDYIEEFIGNLLEFIDTFYDEMDEKIKEIEFVYNYIKGFKDEQENAFKEFIEDTWLNG